MVTFIFKIKQNIVTFVNCLFITNILIRYGKVVKYLLILTHVLRFLEIQAAPLTFSVRSTSDTDGKVSLKQYQRNYTFVVFVFFFE